MIDDNELYIFIVRVMLLNQCVTLTAILIFLLKGNNKCVT